MTAPFGKQPSYADLVQQIADLRKQVEAPLTLKDLPLRDLRSKLIENGEPLDLSILALDPPAGGGNLTVPPVVTSLPGAASDGTIVSYLADPTNGVKWLLQYRAAAASPYKWEFIGGPPMDHEIDTNEVLTGAGAVNYSDLATVGPTLTPPLAGDYMLAYGAEAFDVAAAIPVNLSVAYNGGAATNADRMAWTAPASQAAPGARERKKTLNAGQAVTVKYQVPSWAAGRDGNWRMRWLTMTPIRVG